MWVSGQDKLSKKLRLNLFNNALKKEVKTLWFICSQLFCDFGEEFEVLDQDGEMPASAMIQSVSKVIASICFMLLAYPANSCVG